MTAKELLKIYRSRDIPFEKLDSFRKTFKKGLRGLAFRTLILWFIFLIFLITAGFLVFASIGWTLLELIILQAHISFFLVLLVPITATGIFIALVTSLIKDEREFDYLFLSRESFPDLWNLVDFLSMKIQVPPPKRIALIPEPNAFVVPNSERRGIFEGDFTLGIGYSLFCGLEAHELAGILAHELGHCSQTTEWSAFKRTYRLAYSILKASQPTDFDYLLEQALRGPGLFLFTLPFMFIKSFLAIFRVPLRILSRFAKKPMKFMSHGMEFHADFFEAALNGGQSFQSTCFKLQDLSRSYELTLKDFGNQEHPPDQPFPFYQRLKIYFDIETTRRNPKGKIRNYDPSNWTHPHDERRIQEALKFFPEEFLTSSFPALDLIDHQELLEGKLLTRIQYLLNVAYQDYLDLLESRPD